MRIAHIKDSPEAFVSKTLKMSGMVTFAITFFIFIILSRLEVSLLFLLAVIPIVFIISFGFTMMTPYGIIRQREREINKEVLFAGRYLLVKLESGRPFFNSLIDASKSYGICASYFKEIVDDINTGTPIEQAIDTARDMTPSEKFKRVLWQMGVALKTGTDVTAALRATLDSITAEQVIEIKEYAKKLNAIMMFYMVIACVLPSLGLTMFIIFASFLNFEITTGTLFVILFCFAILQFSFISFIKAARPMVNL